MACRVAVVGRKSSGESTVLPHFGSRLKKGASTCMYGHTYSKSLDQPGKVTSPARGQLNRKNEYFPVRVRA